MLIILNETSKDSTILKKKQPGSSSWSLALSEGAHIKRITDDAREDEILENLQAVGSVHSDLMMMTRAISGEIERQHKVLDEISNKKDVADVNIGRTNTRNTEASKTRTQKHKYFCCF